VLPVGDGDGLAVAFLIQLRAADVEQQSGGLVFDVGQRECDEFGAAHRGGIAEQHDRGVADADNACAPSQQ